MIDPAIIIPKLNQEAERTVADIKRLFADRAILRRLLNTDPELYNELSIHEWHPTLAAERAARYQPMPSGRYVCPRCYIISGQTRELVQISETATLVECTYCGYKLYSESQLSTPPPETDASPEPGTQINLDVHRGETEI